MKKNKIAILSLLSFVAVAGLTGCKNKTSTTSGGGGGDSGQTEPPIVTPEKETLRMGYITISFNEQTYDLSASFAALTGAARYELITVNYGGTTIETKENYVSGTVFNIGSYDDGIYEVKIRAISSDEERYETSEWRTGNKLCNVSHPKPTEQLNVTNARVSETSFEKINGETHWYVKVTYDGLPSGIFASLYLYKTTSTASLKTFSDYASGHKIDLGNLAVGEYTFSLKAFGKETSEKVYLTSEVVRAEGNLVVEETGGEEPPVVPDKTKLVVSNLQISENKVATWEVNQEAENFIVSVWKGAFEQYNETVNGLSHNIKTDTLELGETYTFKVIARGDGVETEDSDTVQLDFKNGEKPAVQKKENVISKFLVYEIVEQNLGYEFSSTYFGGGVIVGKLVEGGQEVFRMDVNDTEPGYFKVSETYAGQEVDFTLELEGNWEYETASKTVRATVPANPVSSSAEITALSAKVEGNQLVISVQISGTYDNVKATVFPENGTPVLLENYVGGKFEMDISSYENFEADIAVNVFDGESETPIATRQIHFTAQDSGEEEMTATILSQVDDGEGNRYFVVSITENIQNVNNFLYGVYSGETHVAGGIADSSTFSTDKKIKFAVEASLMETGNSYTLKLRCEAQDGKFRESINEFTAVSCVVIEQEIEIFDEPCYLSGYYKTASDDVYKLICNDDRARMIYINDEQEEDYSYDYDVSRITMKGTLYTWTYAPKMSSYPSLIIKADTSTLTYTVIFGDEILQETTKPVGPVEETLELTQEDVLTVVRTDYGASYSGGVINVTGVSDAGSNVNYSAYFTQEDLAAGYVQKANGQTLNSSTEALKAEFDGIDLFEVINFFKEGYSAGQSEGELHTLVFGLENVQLLTSKGNETQTLYCVAMHNKDTNQITFEFYFEKEVADPSSESRNCLFERITLSW